MTAPKPAVGLRGTATQVVSAGDTAVAQRSGTVPVFATPRMVALMEQAAVDAITGTLARGETSVGTRVEIAHLAPTPVGATVRAEAILRAIQDRTLIFSVVAWDETGKIGEGIHQRVVVDEARFMRRLGPSS